MRLSDADCTLAIDCPQTHADCASLETRERTWGRKPSLMLSFLGSGKKDQRRCQDEYNELKLACLRNGIVSQCVNVENSITRARPNVIKPVQSNITKQMINKGPGKLVSRPSPAPPRRG